MKILSIGIGLICAASLSGTASAGETYYDAGSKALPLQQAAGTARATAMGSAVVAVPQGSASLLWNPAGLSRIDCKEASIHHNSGLGDTIQETAIFGMPLGDAQGDCKGGTQGGIAASLGYVNYGSFSGRDVLGLEADSYHAGDYSGSVGWGIELLPKLSGGIVFKSNQSNFAGKRYSVYTSDLGLMYSLTPKVDLGLTYSNINLGSKVGDSKLASGWRLGAGWALARHWLLAASGELQNSAVNRFQLGTEYLVGNLEEKNNILALRAGYQANFPDPKLSGLTGLTLGLGYTFAHAWTLDYAMVPTGELGTSNKFSLTYKFGCPEKAKPAAAAAPKPAAPKPVAPVAAPAPKAKPVVVLRQIELEDSHFDFDSSKLRPKGMAALRENVAILKDNPRAMVVVEGYTSKMGTEEYNQKLSERRAQAIADFLVKDGIAESRIETIGYGELRPAVYQATESPKTAAAQANRRVVIRVIEK